MRCGNSDVGTNGAVLSTLAGKFIIVLCFFEKYAQRVEAERHLFLFLFLLFIAFFFLNPKQRLYFAGHLFSVVEPCYLILTSPRIRHFILA
jgi:hypothetical protein